MNLVVHIYTNYPDNFNKPRYLTSTWEQAEDSDPQHLNHLNHTTNLTNFYQQIFLPFSDPSLSHLDQNGIQRFFLAKKHQFSQLALASMCFIFCLCYIKLYLYKYS